MATVQRVSSSTPVPVQQAQLIDPNAFRLSGASAEALGTIGEVVIRIGERDRANKDRIGISNSNAAMDNAQLAYQTDIIGKPLEEHAAILQKHKNAALGTISEQDLSKGQRGFIDSKSDAWGDTFEDTANLATVRARDNDAVIRVTDDYENALTNGIAEDIAEAELALDEQYEGSFEPAEAKVMKEKVEARATKQMTENAKSVIQEQAVLRPEEVGEAVSAEIANRKSGKKPSDEFALLENKDLEDIRDYAKTIGEKRTSDSEIKVTESKVDAFSQIRDGATDIDSMIDAVDADSTISAEDKLNFAKAIPSYFSQWNSTIAAQSSDEDAYDTLTQLSEAVERGAASPAAFEEKYAELKHLLDKDDQRTIRKGDIVATKTMQNRTFSDSLLIARPTLVELTSSDLQSIQIARRNKEIINDIEGVNTFNIAIKKNQAEQWNMGRFRKELRSQIAQNAEWSQEQIFVAQEVLIDQLDLPVGELLKQFDEQNPNDAIMKEPPDIVFKDIWSGLDINQKAKVWELRMRGAPASIIKGEFE